LEELDNLDRQLAGGLDCGQMLGSQLAVSERAGKEISGLYGILDGVVDSDSANGRHDVCGIADEEEPRPEPRRHAARLHRQTAICFQSVRVETRSARIGCIRATSARSVSSPSAFCEGKVPLGMT
jgi:hypothetical protein